MWDGVIEDAVKAKDFLSILVVTQWWDDKR